MNYTWFTMGIDNHKVQEVDIYASLEEVLEQMSTTAWEDDSGNLVDWVTDGERVVAVAVFGPEKDLLVACADGRQLRFGMPERYRDDSSLEGCNHDC